MGFSGKEVELDLEAIEIVGAESGLQYALYLVVVSSCVKFHGSSPDGQIVDYDLALLEGALRDATQFAKLQITQALNPDPDADSEHGKNQAQRTARGPK